MTRTDPPARDTGHLEQTTMIDIPELEPRCGSWIVSLRDTEEVIGEFFDRRTVERFDPERCVVETALQYLGRINVAILEEHRAKGWAR
jgi:hypothetical protein